METKTKSMLAFALCMALAAGIYVWSYPLNQGKVSISTGMDETLVKKGGEIIPCPTDPCLISMKSGTHQVTVEKSGYLPETKTVTFRRFKTESIEMSLKKIPTLKESSVVPAERKFLEKALPPELEKGGVLSFAWDSKGEKLAFLDPADLKLKLWVNGDSKIVTPFGDTAFAMRLLWAPNQEVLLGSSGRNLYRIDTKAASKKKTVLPFDPTHFLWSGQGDFILANDSKNKVYQVEGSTVVAKVTGLGIDLSKASWSQDGKLIYAILETQENRTSIRAFDMSDGTEIEITAKFDFPVSKITMDESGNLYLFNNRQQNWYRLDY